MRAKKSLGQNFLKSTAALRKIIEAGEISPEDTILEIGPGKGVLTEKLLEHAGRLVAVEKDRELFELLQNKFAKEIEKGKLILLNEDILEFEINYPNFKIIANIPYNITGAILKKFLAGKTQPERMILMVQHEVARRIVSEKGSLLSISVKAYGEPKIIMKVPARYFSPQPKVDSAIVAIKNISKKNFTKGVGGREISEESFWKIVKVGFAHKRKRLGGNLKGVIDVKNPVFAELLNKRAEDLTLLDWFSLVPLSGNDIINE